jgi:hypothetical protein
MRRPGIAQGHVQDALSTNFFHLSPSKSSFRKSSALTKASITPTGSLSSTQSSRHCGNRIDCARSVPATPPAIVDRMLQVGPVVDRVWTKHGLRPIPHTGGSPFTSNCRTWPGGNSAPISADDSPRPEQRSQAKNGGRHRRAGSAGSRRRSLPGRSDFDRQRV